MSALENNLAPNENSYNFLRNLYSFDISPYLEADVSNQLEDLGIHYLTRFKEPKMARFIAKQLADIDPIRSRGIEYEILWQQTRFKKASELYQSYVSWPNRTHKQQASYLSKLGNVSEANLVLNKVKFPEQVDQMKNQK